MIERFMKLFAGLNRGHGVYTLPAGQQERPGEKVKGIAKTVHAPVTELLWEAHLKGAKGIGIVPIRDDGTVSFGAIDIDQYTGLDRDAIEQKVRDNKLPLVLCRTKSGGLHLYLFTAEPVPAELARTKLMAWAGFLGYAGVEVFPKQTKLANHNDVGNWINMPYFNGGRTTRYAIRDGKPVVSVPAFLDYAESMRVTEAQLEAIQINLGDALSDGPPCLQRLCAEGFPLGSRNNALFDMGVYAKKAFPDTWERKVDEYNQHYMGPGSSEEVMAVVKSLRKKAYFYRCKELPINQFCDKTECGKRAHGIGTSAAAQVLCVEALTKVLTEEPTWIVTVDGIRIEMTTEVLRTQRAFNNLCLAKANKIIPAMKVPEWDEFIQKLVNARDEVEAPPDAGPEGQFKHLMEEFLLTSPQARTRDELLQGKPWVDDGRVYFRAPDLMRYLERERFKTTERWVYLSLGRNGRVDHHQYKLLGKCVQCWSIPALDQQTDDFAVPRVDDEVGF